MAMYIVYKITSSVRYSIVLHKNYRFHFGKLSCYYYCLLPLYAGTTQQVSPTRDLTLHWTSPQMWVWNFLLDEECNCDPIGVCYSHSRVYMAGNTLHCGTNLKKSFKSRTGLPLAVRLQTKFLGHPASSRNRVWTISLEKLRPVDFTDLWAIWLVQQHDNMLYN